MPNPAPTIAERLADHFTSLTADTIPSALMADVRMLVQDYLGVAISGSRTGSGRVAAQFAMESGGGEEAAVIGHGGRTGAMNAAFANAIASHSIELDDVDILALFHFSPPVISAALAVAEKVNANGRDFLVAAAAGCEMMARASDATNNSLRNRGFHTTPTCGVFGATVAAGLLLGLDRDQMVSALGLAGAQASGLMEMYGPSMQKRFNPGPAARNGIAAARMAQLGFTGAATIFEGERGFCRAFSDEADPGKLVQNLGTDFPVYIEYKAFSCARPIHNAIGCALDVREQMQGKPASTITAMTMRRHPDWAHYHMNARPSTYHEAQMSLPYSVAIALVEGGALPDQYRNDKLADPELLRLSDLVKVVPDATLPRGVSCHLTVETKDGQSYTSQVDYPRGSIENPMSPEDMDRKTRMLADPVIGDKAAQDLIGRVRDLEKAASIRDIMRLTAAKAG